jgi:hypothetical protein
MKKDIHFPKDDEVHMAIVSEKEEGVTSLIQETQKSIRFY